MGIRSKLLRAFTLLAALTLVLTACQQQQQQDTGQGTGEVKTDVGVTKEACPDAVNKDNGCIFLGALSDLTKGPFAALAVPITDAQKAFWKLVNEQGGIGNAYDVNIEANIRDNEYNPQVHVTKYDEIQPNIVALAQTLGTPMTLAALAKYKADKIIGAPASWWSGWEFEDQILESGNNYCLESMNAVDYAVDELKVKSLMTVHYPGDYGGDAANGARHAATARKLEDKGDHVTAPNATAGTQDAAVEAIIKASPELVVITTGPREFAEIVGKVAARGFTGRFLGTSPVWNKGLLATASGPAIEKLALVSYPWPPWGADTPGHKAMREALGTVDPNDGYTAGWAWSYPLKATLENAHDAGDLTRAGLVSAASKLKTVDYEGMLPQKAGLFEGNPGETVYRENLILKPDKAAVTTGTGLSVVDELAVGPTAKAYKFDKPCQEVPPPA
jgi:ABC-type branched-subunit amino acid transport system substrate-binding protein